jgi:anti-anti-sigma factor
MPRDPDDGRAELLFEQGDLTLRSERVGAVHTISVDGELDLATCDAAEQELLRVEGTDAAAIVLDLSGLTFMDSTGVRLVMAANARSRADANRLRLVRGPRAVQRVFELCGVVELLPFAE